MGKEEQVDPAKVPRKAQKVALGLEAKRGLAKLVPMRGLDLVVGATQGLVERQDQDLAVGKSQYPVVRKALTLALALTLTLALAPTLALALALALTLALVL